jgi:hypothetical protein
LQRLSDKLETSSDLEQAKKIISDFIKSDVKKDISSEEIEMVFKEI